MRYEVWDDAGYLATRCCELHVTGYKFLFSNLGRGACPVKRLNVNNYTTGVFYI